MPCLDDRIRAFLAGDTFAVVGASRDRRKYGNMVLRVYQQHHRTVYPVNPGAGEIEGLAAYADLASLPRTPHGVSIITPPKVTERIVERAIDLGIGHLWMQPGAESAQAVRRAEQADMNVIGGDACILVTLGFDNHTTD